MTDWQYVNVMVVMFAAYILLPSAITSMIWYTIARRITGAFWLAAAVGAAIGYVLLAGSPREYLDPQDEITANEKSEGCSGTKSTKVAA